jgi:hypothetical protein
MGWVDDDLRRGCKNLGTGKCEFDLLSRAGGGGFRDSKIKIWPTGKSGTLVIGTRLVRNEEVGSSGTLGTW